MMFDFPAAKIHFFVNSDKRFMSCNPKSVILNQQTKKDGAKAFFCPVLYRLKMKY